MIPKTIHYCWFGGKPLSELALKCIESWKKFCPDYEIMRWDESNFDFASCDYAREAYAAKKYAFVSDYARLKVLVDHGGVYMDTDVEVINPLDKFMSEHAFSGFESQTMIPTGIIACEKGFAMFAEMLREYDTRHFILSDGSIDLTTNVTAITNYCSLHGFIPNNTKQTINGFTLYPKDYFCPKTIEVSPEGILSFKMEMTENTCTIHHFAGSWLPKQTLWLKFKRRIQRLIGKKLTEKILAVKRFFRRILIRRRLRTW